MPIDQMHGPIAPKRPAHAFGFPTASSKAPGIGLRKKTNQADCSNSLAPSGQSGPGGRNGAKNRAVFARIWMPSYSLHAEISVGIPSFPREAHTGMPTPSQWARTRLLRVSVWTCSESRQGASHAQVDLIGSVLRGYGKGASGRRRFSFFFFISMLTMFFGGQSSKHDACPGFAEPFLGGLSHFTTEMIWSRRIAVFETIIGAVWGVKYTSESSVWYCVDPV